ncbi:MAG: ABC transporter ATP-binding protein [Clostridia bacterium]|nr:ABC transporter ATP-binding protein [Clostridia bacterium]
MQGGGRGAGLAGRGGNGGEKPTAKKSWLLMRLYAYLGRYRWLLILALLMTIGTNLLSLVGPSLSGAAINALSGGEGQVDFAAVYHYALLMILFYLGSSVLSYLLSLIMIRLSRSVTYAMRKDVFDHLTRLPVGFFDKNQAGNIISVISYDIDTINTSLSSDLVQILTSIITVVGSLFMMIRISPALVLVFVVTIPLSVLFTRYMSRKVRPLYRKRSSTLGEMNGFVEETLSGQRTVRAYRREGVMEGIFREKNVAAAVANYEAESRSATVGPSVGFINNLSLALISMFGAIMYMRGGILLGDISSFVLYSRRFSGPINEFANILAELQSTLAAAERVFRLLDEPTEPADPPNAARLTDIRGEVDFRHVSFGYERDRTILHDLSFHAGPGQVTAIVGPTGAGKTTIINLLMRFYDVNGGAILLDGTDIRELRRSDLRGAFTMVLQDTWLFEGTVLENLTYGREGVTREQAVEAAKAAHIHAYIEALPNGYDTVLKQGGVSISGGQRQLLTIARAMLSDAKMLILDEATSNVDTQTERRIHAAMMRLMKGRTCFVIAHRLSTIEHADHILVVRDGDVVESGTHQALMDKKGAYYRLYISQFEPS